MLTTDPIYWKPLLPKIVITNVDQSSTYYTYDSIVDTATIKPVYCRVELGTDHQGTFEVQFENSGLTLDTTNIKNGQRVIISLKKDTSLSFNTLIMGLIRKTGWERGIGGKALYTISGSSIAIRMNERITYTNRTATKDGTTGAINTADSTMFADALLQSIINTATESNFYNATTLSTDSDVENFLASLVIEYGELQDAVNAIEEPTGAEFFIDP